MSRAHGGPDAAGVPRWDFSTNSNACGPCPQAWRAVQASDASRYPDPGYTELRAALARLHGVAEERLVLGTGSSELIARLTAWVARGGGRRVWLPTPAYGDYAHAATQWRLTRVATPAEADLAWCCAPSSPRGVAEPTPWASLCQARVLALDRAYEPLRLSGSPPSPAQCDQAWQLWSPNKALGLTGVRGAYAIAPPGATAVAAELADMAASWPLGAHAVALLLAWTRADTQDWLHGSRAQLRAWKAGQTALLQSLGWTCLPSDTPYFCARPPRPLDGNALRRQGIKLRPTDNLGLGGHWRLSVQPPAAQAALHQALDPQP
ncbi:aminotransferase class I/II-fold pyridoxal phosphate-dependent enzyme [Hydrogenophaga sp. OTU3427]|uniref:aminotransferase class I/II-fold pyridoxal phosphate-dependent enzyme n=1 Tax=Hydrogenophaga sp. OTU3427 TaxID=3043856 RepID=UPI00313C4F6E